MQGGSNRTRPFGWMTRLAFTFSAVFFAAMLGGVALAQQQNPLGQDVYRKVQEAAYQVLTAPQPDAPKMSYGTGFAVSRDGKLITNYHVVAGALHKPKESKIFVGVKGVKVEAKVIAFSVWRDLALINIQKELPEALVLAPQEPDIGEKIFSVGIPEDLNLSLIEGVYNGLVTEGPYEKIHMSAPLNSGMSGGPVVNSRGEVVGVNVSTKIFSQNLSFAVPVRFVVELQAEAARLTGGSLSSTEESSHGRAGIFHQEVEEQLNKVQQVIADSWKNKPQQKLRLGKWELPKLGQNLKCWSEPYIHPKQKYEKYSEQCRINSGIYLKEGVYTGSYEMTYRLFTNKSLNLWQLIDLFNNERLRSSLLSYGFKYSENEEDATRFDCWSGTVNTSSGGDVLASYCMRGYIDYRDLYDLQLRFVTLSNWQEVLTYDATLSGFKLENIKHFIEEQLDGLVYGGAK